MKAPSTPTPKPDDGPWVPLGNGRFRSATTGRLKYDPHSDPAWQADIKRIEAETAARKAAGR